MQYGTARRRILLGKETHSARPVAWAAAGRRTQTVSSAASGASQDLFIPESLDRVKPRGPSCGIKSRDQADQDRKANRAENQPPGDGKDVRGRQVLPMQINICAPGHADSDKPAEA